MIVFFDEDRAYLAWLARHRGGFVLDALRRPTKKQPTLHRAICNEVRRSPTKRSHWTTGRHLKACAAQREELTAWSAAESVESRPCPQCRPDEVTNGDQFASTSGRHGHLTKLGKEVVDYVTDVALIHLDNADRQYDLTVGDVARCLNKTPAQMTAVLMRLFEDGYLRLAGQIVPGIALPENRNIYPTAELFRTLPVYATAPLQAVEAELSRLREDRG